MTSNVKYRSNIIILCLLLLIGFILRFYQLGDESICLDEGYSIYHAKLDFTHVILTKDDIPPLYYVILHGWIKLFGDSEAAVRFPSLIFGLISILMIYKIGALLFDDNKGILAALLLTVSAFHVHYSQEARMYSLTAFLTLLSMYYFIKLKTEGGRAASTGYVLSSTFLIYSHIFGLFIILAQNIYLLTLFFFSKKELAISLIHWVSIQAIIFILFIPWIPIFITRVFNEFRAAYMKIPTKRTVYRTFQVYSGKYMLILCLFCACLSMVSIKLRNGVINAKTLFSSVEKLEFKVNLEKTGNNYLLLLWLGLPIILPILLSNIVAPFYANRYTIGASLSFYLLVASGIGNFRHPIKSVVIVIIMALSILNLWSYYNYPTREQWRDVAKYVDQHSKKDELIIFNSKECHTHAFSYYSRAKAMQKVLQRNWNQVDMNEKSNLSHLLNNHNRVWVVLSHPNKNELLIKTLKKTYRQLELKKYIGIMLYLFESDIAINRGS